MRRRFLAGVLAWLLILTFVSGGMASARSAVASTTKQSAVPAGTYSVRHFDERWSMRDGVSLPVSIYYPVPKRPGESFPVVIFVHPWDMDRSTFRDQAASYASRGYIGVTFTVRGWFGAGGQIGCFDPDKEMKDLSAIITRVAGDRRLRVLKDSKGPVVGVTGYSMGACMTWLIAPRKNPRSGDPGDPRVRAVAPQHGGFDLLSSMYPNGAVKWAWADLLLFGVYNGTAVGALMNTVSAILDPEMDPLEKLIALLNVIMDLKPGNVTPELLRIYDIAVNRRTDEMDDALSFFRVRSARYWCDEEMDGRVEHPITVPTLIVTGWKDDLFTPNEGLGAFSSAVAAPKRTIITNAGHAGDMPIPYLPSDPVKEWTRHQIEKWFDRYLKGAANGAEQDPAVSFYRDWDPSSFGASSTWPPVSERDSVYYLGGRSGFRVAELTQKAPKGLVGQEDLLINNGLSGSLSLPYFGLSAGDPGIGAPPDRIKIMDLPFTRYSYLSEPLAGDLTLAGTPKLSLSYRCTRPYAQLIPLLYEVRPDGSETLVSRGWYEGHCEQTWTKTGTGEKPIEMVACCHRFTTGSRLRLDIQTSDLSMTWPYWGFSVLSLLHDDAGPPTLSLPTTSGVLK